MNMPKSISSNNLNKTLEYFKKNKGKYLTVGDIRKNCNLHHYSAQKAISLLIDSGEIEELKSDKADFFRLKE